MTGVDYSSNSIALCRDIAKKREIEGIRWEVCDCLQPNPQLGLFDLVLDKGVSLPKAVEQADTEQTYDAISLASAEKETDAPRLKYGPSIASLLKPEGLFVITSCNWTEDELRQHFKDSLAYHSHIPRPKFAFGGQQGSTIATVIFKRKS
jgi:hypothetical protein